MTALISRQRPLAVLAASFVIAAAMLPPVAANAAGKPAAPAAKKVEFHTEPQPLANGYAPFAGEPFFLLTDAAYGSG
ncbi:MAG: hypothetical protein ABJD97_24395, partial [Betaproteobacteria bacterium]